MSLASKNDLQKKFIVSNIYKKHTKYVYSSNIANKVSIDEGNIQKQIFFFYIQSVIKNSSGLLSYHKSKRSFYFGYIL